MTTWKNEKPWHGAGGEIDANLTAHEMLIKAKLDHSAGKTDVADIAMKEWEEKYGEENPVGLASIHAWRVESDAAFEWLEKAYAMRDPSLAYLKRDIDLRSLHSDPRWKVLLEKIGLPTD